MDVKRRTMTSDWDVVVRLLPANWASEARELKALRRTRGIADAETLLRVLLIHLAGGCSLKETVLRAREAGWCSISAVALLKRLRGAEEWLRWLAEHFWRECGARPDASGRRLRVVDGTTISEPGPTGSQWRVHYAINLSTLQCDYYELTDVRGGESFRRFPVTAGDVVLGDRGYARAPGIGYIVGEEGDVLVRLHVQSLPLYEANGKRLSLRSRVRCLKIGMRGDWQAFVHAPGGPVRGRLIAIKRSQAAAERVRLRMKRRARHNKQEVSARALELAGYVLLWTTLPKKSYSAKVVLDTYRWRWQIELAIKRMKSIMALGALPKKTDASSRAWLQGKLLVALLVERLWHEAESLSPWGYPLERPSEPLA
jgi:hypothetical protein